MIPLSIPDIRGPAAKNLYSSVKKNWVSSAGPDVKFFEVSMRKYLNSKYAISTSSGSAALYVALLALGIKTGQKVLVPDYTFAATVNAVIMLGAIPVFIDVEPATWIMDANLVKKAIDIYNPVAIIVVDTLGHSFNRDVLLKLSRSKKIPLIEDAAGALGAQYNNMMCGALADIGILSFNGNKLLTTGSGGMLITNNKTLAMKAKNILSQYRKSNSYEYSGIGFNFNTSNLNAVLGLTQMPFLNSILKNKKNIANRYDKYFLSRKDIEIMPRNEWSKNNFWLYSIRLSSSKEAKRLVSYLKNNGIEARVFWYGLSSQTPYKGYNKLLSGVSKILSGSIVSIPSSSSLKLIDQQKVIDVFSNFETKKVNPIEVINND
ncbi:aminotransferase class I/II-fold pyridoxal phosphate-dependent enzyme [Alphaproteobacteria bacterium]|nr:aminotransferase class I/II-fold pyridoxal phosphate-dependent enzyme [Alphaproteobacteria bacterium]